MNNHHNQEKQEQNYDSRSIIAGADHNNNNYNIAHGAGRVPLSPDQTERIRDAYTDNIGPMTGAVARMIETAIDHGLTVKEVIEAIEETGFAPRPSPWYLKKILEIGPSGA